MAIVNNGLLLDFTGRVGNLVFYKNGGKICVREVGRKAAGPATLLQQQQRMRIRAVAVFYQAVREAGLQPGWGYAAEKLPLNAYNLFVHYNILVFSGDGLITDFHQVRLTTGQVPLPERLCLKRVGRDRIEVKWKLTKAYLPDRLTDRLALAFMKSPSVYTVHVPEIPPVRRGDCGSGFVLPAEYAAYPHCFCFFKSETSEEVSRSRYFFLNS